MDEGDDTVRQLLMDNPDMSLSDLHRAAKQELLGWNLGDTERMWTKYRGWDGRTSPTHDVETGGTRHE